MTYWDSEKSLEGSTPVEIHEFSTDSEAWRYADGAEDVLQGGYLYTAALCHGQKIESGGSAIKNRTTVYSDWSLPFAWQYVQCPPDGVVSYVRKRLQGSDYVVMFRGTVIDVSFHQASRQGDRHAEIIIDPFTGDLARSGLMIKYTRRCGVSLYSEECGVDGTSSGSPFIVAGTLTSVSSTALQGVEFASKVDGWFNGGKIEALGRRRKILSHVGNEIVIASAIPDLAASDTFLAFAGCNRLHTTCHTKFNNLANCKAHPNIPATDDMPFGDNGVTV